MCLFFVPAALDVSVFNKIKLEVTLTQVFILVKPEFSDSPAHSAKGL